MNSQSYKNLTGKMLEIKTSVDGLEVKASDLTGKYTEPESNGRRAFL